MDINVKRDLIAICTDGAEVEIKMAKLLGIISTLCMAHGLHLAVTDVLYKDKTENDENDESESEDEDDYDGEDEEEDHEGEIDEVVELADIKCCINKMKKIITFFRKSAVRNDALQVHTIKELGRELQLCRDCRTRDHTAITSITFVAFKT